MIKKLFSAESKPGAFFRHIDWTAFWGATLLSFLVYFFTLGPSVGLEDSGELTTAADHLGVPHPPGYPFWTMCSWVFCRVFSWVHYMGQPTPAWAVALFSAVAGAFAAGCTAMLICRSGSDMLDSMDLDAKDALQRVPHADAEQRHALMGFAGGLGGSLVFAFSPVEWSQSTIVEIYSLNALFLMAVFLLSYRWMRKPSDKILWLTAFVFGLGLTNYQVLLLAALPLVLIILLKDIRLFRDLLLILIPIGLTVQVLQVGSKSRAAAAMAADVINKFEPVLLAESCPNEAMLWIAFVLVFAAPVVGGLLSATTRRRQTALCGALGIGLAGVGLIALANTVFAETPIKVETLEQVVEHIKGGTLSCAWTDPSVAPLIQPAKYTWIALFLAASCVLSLGAVFAPSEARLLDQRVWTWLVGAGICALAAGATAACIPAAGDGGFRGEVFSWTFNTACLVVGLSLLLILAFLTPRQRGLAFAIPVAAVQATVFILLHKGAMNGLTHPTTWWFFWPCIWNFVMLGLAVVALPNGRSIGLAMLFAELGVSFYAYMPIVSDLRNPPMNWGYPRTWEGFKHAILRGQYEQIKMPSIFSKEGFELFCKQMGFYFQDLRMQFTLVAAALAILPFTLWKFVVKTKRRAFSLPAASVAVGLYVATAALVAVFSELFEVLTDGEVPWRLDKFLLIAMAALAVIGVGAMVVRQLLVILRQLARRGAPATTGSPVRVQFLADDVTQQWLIAVGVCFAVMSFALVALANVKGDIQDGFIQKVKFISSHAMFSLWIGYGLVIGLIVANRLAARFIKGAQARRIVFGFLCTCAAGLALIPVYENYTNDKLVFAMGSAEQNGHTFGWQFGNYQLRGANAIREELSQDEEPLPNPLWPEEMGPSAVFFGGTDPGRFVPTYMIYSANVRPDVFLITQNALADDTYMSVERDLYGDEIWIPSKNDSAEAFNIYVTEVQSGKRRANGDLRIENGRVQVTGALGVMEINGILTKMMFDHERLRRAFYVEESYVIPWMYDYLTPHGLIMKINANANVINDAIVRNDMEFWDWYTRRLLKDPAFRRDFPAQKSFSKLRAAIAGLYANMRSRPYGGGNDAGKSRERCHALAAQAYQEAVSLYPASPEASFRYIQDILLANGKWDAMLDLLYFTNRIDPNSDRIKDKDEDNEKTKGLLSHARAINEAPSTMNAILRKYWKRETPPPDMAQAPFPDEIREQLSEDELDSLVQARLDYAEACIHFGDLNHAFQSLAFLKNNPARDKTFDSLWRATKVMQTLYKYSKDHRCGIECADLAAKSLDSVKPEENSFKIQDMAVNIFYDAYQIYKEELVRNASKSDHYKAILRGKMNEEISKCDKAITSAMEFMDEKDFLDKKPPLSKKDVLNCMKVASALHYVSILEDYGNKDLVKSIVGKAHLAKPERILSLAEQILRSNVNSDGRAACAQYVGTSILDPLMGRMDTTVNDLYQLSQLYRVCCSWSTSLAQTKSFAEKSVSCYSQFAKALDEKDPYLRLAEMYDWEMLFMPNEKDKLTACKDEATRNAGHACLKMVGKCIMSKEPNLNAAKSFIDEAKRINPDCMKGMSLFTLINLK